MRDFEQIQADPFTKGKTLPRLRVIDELTRRLHDEDILYCHWKSNEHLRASMLGQTDLDVLMDPLANPKLETILSQIGFKRFAAVPHRAYPGLDDYLASDPATGTIVHLHLHYQLTLGEKNLKGYCLPWAQLMLSSRVYDSENDIYVTDPNLELILLMVRAALKIRTRDYLLALGGLAYFRGDAPREFGWLQQRVSIERVRELAEELLGKEAQEGICDILASPRESRRDSKNLFRLRRVIQSALKPYRSYPPYIATLHRWTREARTVLAIVMKKYLHAPIAARRTSPRGGLIVAFLGADGSGKSTVTSDVRRWLGQKVDVLPIYFGCGDGSSSALRIPFNVARKAVMLKRSSKASERSRQGAAQSGRNLQNYNPIMRAGWFLWALTVAYEKRRRLKRAWKARNKGMVVVCDRYPQHQILGFNDGPLLPQGERNTSGLSAWLQKWEFAAYQMAALNPPDVVIKLQASPATAFSRKPETSLETIQEKTMGFASLSFPAMTSVVTIDADQPLDDVLIAVKHAIWRHL